MADVFINFWVAFLVIFVMTLVFSTLFIFGRISKRFQAGLDLIWICVGSLGIITITEANKKRYFQIRYDSNKEYIQRESDYIIRLLENPDNCRIYEFKSFWQTEEEFNKLSEEANYYCEWTKNMIHQFISQEEIDEVIILPPDGFEGNTVFIQYYQLYVGPFEFYNEKVREFLYYEKELSDDSVLFNKNTFGLLGLYIALSLRLSLSIFRLWEANKQKRDLSIPPQELPTE